MTPTQITQIFGYDTEIIRAWKLVQIVNGEIHPIRANTHRVFPVGVWLNATDFQEPEQQNDAWFHAMVEADDYYLTRDDYRFIEVEMQYTRTIKKDDKPDWVQGKRMMILNTINK